MKKKLLTITIPLLLSYGCVTTDQYNIHEDRIVRLEEELKKEKATNEELQETLHASNQFLISAAEMSNYPDTVEFVKALFSTVKEIDGAMERYSELEKSSMSSLRNEFTSNKEELDQIFSENRTNELELYEKRNSELLELFAQQKDEIDILFKGFKAVMDENEDYLNEIIVNADSKLSLAISGINKSLKDWEENSDSKLNLAISGINKSLKDWEENQGKYLEDKIDDNERTLRYMILGFDESLDEVVKGYDATLDKVVKNLLIIKDSLKITSDDLEDNLLPGEK